MYITFPLLNHTPTRIFSCSIQRIRDMYIRQLIRTKKAKTEESLNNTGSSVVAAAGTPQRSTGDTLHTYTPLNTCACDVHVLVYMYCRCCQFNEKSNKIISKTVRYDQAVHFTCPGNPVSCMYELTSSVLFFHSYLVLTLFLYMYVFQ